MYALPSKSCGDNSADALRPGQGKVAAGPQGVA